MSTPNGHGVGGSGPTPFVDSSQYAGNRAATVKMSGVPSLGAEAAFDFLGVRTLRTNRAPLGLTSQRLSL